MGARFALFEHFKVLKQTFRGGLVQDSKLVVATCMGGMRLRSTFVSYYLMTQLVKESNQQKKAFVA